MSETQASQRVAFWSTASALPEDVFAVWRKPDAAITPVAIVATTDADGAPRTAPFGSLRAVTPQLLRLACWCGHDTYANLRRGARLSVALMCHNSAVSVIGSPRVVREHMEADEQFAIVDIDVEEVKNDMVYRIVIESGIEIAAREKYKLWYDAAMQELDALGQLPRT
jgi:hypothetical protein